MSERGKTYYWTEKRDSYFSLAFFLDLWSVVLQQTGFVLTVPDEVDVQTLPRCDYTKKPGILFFFLTGEHLLTYNNG